MKPKTLKEMAVDHDYYCHDNNYYSNEPATTYNTFEEFFEEEADMDIDMNLIFRWDVKECYDEDDEPLGLYRLHIYIIQQRKGIFRPIFIKKIRDKNVPALVDLLEEHYQKLQKIWKPL